MRSKSRSEIKTFVRRFIKEERAAQSIEAAIIYPIVVLFLFFLIYIGLYIMHTMTVGAYAEKVAMLAAREVGHPGYLDMFINGGDVFSTSATEGDYGNTVKMEGSKLVAVKANANAAINISTDNSDIKLTAYRYWSGNPLGDSGSAAYEGILRKIIKNNSLLATKGTINVKVKCENVFITQYINVEVSQQMMEIPIFTFFGIKTPTVNYTASASVSDTDEFIRNINFAADAIEEIASRCGVNVDGLKDKVKKVKDMLDKL